MNSKTFFKTYKEIFTVILVNLIFLGIFIELGSAGFYFLKYKELFYSRKKNQNLVSSELVNLGINQARLQEGIIERLHPVFGYSMTPRMPFKFDFSEVVHKTNNYGFVSQYEYPIKRNQNQFIVGVLGGSVANNYAVYENEVEILAKILKEKVPSLANKEIIVLPLAMGGYKQPQQLMILNYFLSIGQDLDLVINIDGFNDVAIATMNYRQGIEPTIPSIQHLQSLQSAISNLSLEELTTIAKINQTKTELKNTLENLDQCWLASCYTFHFIKTQSLAKTYQNEIYKFKQISEINQAKETDPLLLLTPKNYSLTDNNFIDKIVKTWYRSSVQINEVLAAKNIPYFHIIQPNQYYKTQRVFSAEEKKIAMIKDSPYIEGVTKGYPILLSKIKELQQENVQIFDGTQMFDQVPEIVYFDNCCHYNQKGMEIFSEEIGNWIAGTLNQNPPIVKSTP
jgi:hypothetical protein